MRRAMHASRVWRLLIALLFVLLVALFGVVRPLSAAVADSAIWVLDIRGPIGPATAEYVVDNLELAAPVAQAVVLRIDTQGGLDQAMRDINQAILASPIPVLAWVEPKGARAASAGTYILYASHFAAMAPATSIGAATPVQLGVPAPQPPSNQPGSDQPGSDQPGSDQPGLDQPGLDQPGSDQPGAASPDAPPGDAMSRKIVNDAAAYLRGLAELRGRNRQWAERAVRLGESLSSREALELGVIEAVCADLEQLVQAASEQPLQVDGGAVQLDADNARVEYRQPNWRQRLLATITNPNIAYLLLIAGCYGLLLEFYSPGVLIPGIGGAICLLLALYAFQILPISYAGLALLLLGIALVIAEAMAPGLGLFGVGGAIAFAVGSLMLFDSDLSGVAIHPGLIVATTVSMLLLSAAVATLALRARQQRVVSGSESMIGMVALALEDFDGRGRVQVAGELWQASCPVAVRRGERRAVSAVVDLTVELEEEVLK